MWSPVPALRTRRGSPRMLLVRCRGGKHDPGLDSEYDPKDRRRKHPTEGQARLPCLRWKEQPDHRRLARQASRPSWYRGSGPRRSIPRRSYWLFQTTCRTPRIATQASWRRRNPGVAKLLNESGADMVGVLWAALSELDGRIQKLKVRFHRSRTGRWWYSDAGRKTQREFRLRRR